MGSPSHNGELQTNRRVGTRSTMKKSNVSIQIIGGTKNFRFEKIKELAPDLIIGNKEENYQAGINQLRHDFPVWMSDNHTLKDAFSMMSSLGVLCQEEVRAETIIEECTKALHKVKDAFDATVVYLIWKDPWMAVGRHTFVDHMLTHLGYRNLIKIDRYPELDTATIKAQQPDKVLLSSEPYPFKRADLSQVRALWPNAEIELVDGELFSWYGSRLRKWSLN